MLHTYLQDETYVSSSVITLATIWNQKRSSTAGCYYIPSSSLHGSRFSRWPLLDFLFFELFFYYYYFVRRSFFLFPCSPLNALLCLFLKKNIEPLRMQHQATIKLFSIFFYLFFFTFEKENVEYPAENARVREPFLCVSSPQTKCVSRRDGTNPKPESKVSFTLFRISGRGGITTVVNCQAYRVGEILYIYIYFFFWVNAHHWEQYDLPFSSGEV